MLAVLVQRDFAFFWFSQLISMLGDMVLFIALPFYVYETTGSTLATGTMFIVQTVPRLLLGPVAGVFVDRWNRKLILVVSLLVRGAVLCMLLVVAVLDEWFLLIYGVTFLLSIISLFFLPAKNAVLPTLVDQQLLVQANSLNAFSNGLATLLGPLAGGALLEFVGLANLVFFSLMAYLLSASLMALVKIPSATPPQNSKPGAKGLTSVRQEFVDGLQLMQQDRVIATIMVVTAVTSFGQGMITVLLIVFAKEHLAGGALALGWIVAAQGAGGLVGALSADWISRFFQPIQLISLGPGLSGLLLVAIINVPMLVPVTVGLGLAGLLMVNWTISQQTLLQRSVDDRFRGRVFASLSTITAFLVLAGTALTSTLGEALGTMAMLHLAGALFIAAGLAVPAMRSKPTDQS
jgi:MFS family permease